MTDRYIGFRKVSDPFGWMGNMSPYAIEYCGEAWRTSEHLFQAGRFGNKFEQDLIRAERSPMSAKMLAKKFQTQGRPMILTPRSTLDVAWMKEVLGLKVSQHPTLGHFLLDTGDAVIFEDVSARPASPSADFWGARVQPDGSIVGENVLGKLWMAIREEWRK